MLKNKTFGSALIIAGTTIGAGMLAIPAYISGYGLWLYPVIARWLVGLVGLQRIVVCRSVSNSGSVG